MLPNSTRLHRMKTPSDEREKRRKRKRYTNFCLCSSDFYSCCLENRNVTFFFLFVFLQDDINTIDMEEDKRDLISREISKFRDTHKVKLLLLNLQLILQVLDSSCLHSSLLELAHLVDTFNKLFLISVTCILRYNLAVLKFTPPNILIRSILYEMFHIQCSTAQVGRHLVLCHLFSGLTRHL